MFTCKNKYGQCVLLTGISVAMFFKMPRKRTGVGGRGFKRSQKETNALKISLGFTKTSQPILLLSNSLHALIDYFEVFLHEGVFTAEFQGFHLSRWSTSADLGD